MALIRWYAYRSSVNGQWVPKSYALAHPHTTERQQVTLRKKLAVAVKVKRESQ